MSAGRKEGWEEKKKGGRKGEREGGRGKGRGRKKKWRKREGRRKGGRRKEGEKEEGRDKCNTALTAASRSNHWHLSELLLNEGLSYHVFALLLYT